MRATLKELMLYTWINGTCVGFFDDLLIFLKNIQEWKCLVSRLFWWLISLIMISNSAQLHHTVLVRIIRTLKKSIFLVSNIIFGARFVINWKNKLISIDWNIIQLEIYWKWRTVKKKRKCRFPNFVILGSLGLIFTEDRLKAFLIEKALFSYHLAFPFSWKRGMFFS